MFNKILSVTDSGYPVPRLLGLKQYIFSFLFFFFNFTHASMNILIYWSDIFQKFLSSSKEYLKSIYMYTPSCVYICIYRYPTMTDVCTAVLLPTKPTSNNDSGFRHSFEAETSLPLTQSAPAVTHDTTRLCWIVFTQINCHIHADVVRALSCFFFYVFPLVWWRKSKISQECWG